MMMKINKIANNDNIDRWTAVGVRSQLSHGCPAYRVHSTQRSRYANKVSIPDCKMKRWPAVWWRAERVAGRLAEYMYFLSGYLIGNFGYFLLLFLWNRELSRKIDDFKAGSLYKNQILRNNKITKSFYALEVGILSNKSCACMLVEAFELKKWASTYLCELPTVC